MIGSEDNILIPSNIPTVDYNKLSEEEALMFFVQPKDLYVEGLKNIVKCTR